MVDKAKKYINTHFINNPEFQKLPDLKSKVLFVFENLLDKFNEWWKSTGTGMMQEVMSTLTDFIINALEIAVPRLVEIGIRIGVGIADGIAEGIAKNSAVAGILGLNSGAGSGVGGAVKLAEKLKANPTKGSSGPTVNLLEKMQSLYNSTPTQTNNPFAPKSLQSVSGFNGGLRNVPYNNYPARLHAGEAVLPREEAKTYRGESGASGGGKTAPVVNINGPIHINNGMDYDAFVGRLAHDLAM
ncbi:hypothetical protein AMS62_11420 [Bacillus sp. FJAT-18019]|nr:hypothetical protein AMS62_11420 [Bacillus sp. FJAT-18019]